MLAAHAPDSARMWALDKRRQLSDGPLLECYRILGQALDYTEDDPRLVEIADRIGNCIEHLGAGQASHLIGGGIESPLARPLDALAFDSALSQAADRTPAPAWLDRLGPHRPRPPLSALNAQSACNPPQHSSGLKAALQRWLSPISARLVASPYRCGRLSACLGPVASSVGTPPPPWRAALPPRHLDGFERKHLHVRGDQWFEDTFGSIGDGTPPRPWRCSDLEAARPVGYRLLSTYVEVFRRRRTGRRSVRPALHGRGGVP